MKKHAGHGYHRTEIEHHSDGSHTVRHHAHHESPDMANPSYAAANLDGVHDGLQEHLGMPNPGEAAANAGPMPTPAAPGPMPGA